jgi:methyl-accepting chemotaxis protein
VTTDAVPKWLGWLWVIGALMAMVGAIVGVVAGWGLAGSVRSSVTETVVVTERVLETVGETTRVIDGVFDDVAASLREVQTTLSDTSLTLARASNVTANLGGVISTDVPASVDSIRAALPALIDTARVIDGTMRGLSFFGVHYEPEVALDDSLSDIDAQLAEIPVLLRAQHDTLRSVAGDLGAFSSSTVEISDNLAAIRVRLAEASTVLAGYGSIVDDSTVLLDDLSADVERGVGALRLVIALVGLGIVATQTFPLAAGLMVIRRPSDE